MDAAESAGRGCMVVCRHVVLGWEREGEGSRVGEGGAPQKAVTSDHARPGRRIGAGAASDHTHQGSMLTR